MSQRRQLRVDIDPLSLQNGLERITQRMGIASPDTITTLFGQWNQLVGDALADHVVPLQIRDRILYVEVPDPSWALQMRYLESRILAKIADRIGPNLVENVSVRVKSHQLD